MSVKSIAAIIAVAGLLFLGTAVYAHGPGMGWGYGPGNGGHMMGGYGWGHHMGYNGYGPHMGYGYHYDNRDRQSWQGQPDNNQYYGYYHGPGYHHGWTNEDGEW